MRRSVMLMASGLLLCCTAEYSAGGAADQPILKGLPGKLEWLNAPAGWHVDNETSLTSVLTIKAGKQTDWFVDPFNGETHKNAPILLFSPAKDFVFSAQVKVAFKTKWDAGALMLWADERRWAKLSFELSPKNEPTMVTVVTRGFSDDCNSITVRGNTVYVRIAKSGPAYVFYSSEDGKDWHILRVFELGNGPEPRIGLEAQSPAGQGAEVTFTNVRYEARKIADVYNEP
jgi:uncharacterized protein